MRMLVPSVLQGTPLDLSRPWKRATMHDLVQEATGVDFESFGGDLEKARAAALEAVAAAGGNTRSPSLRTATSVGYLLNEVRQQAQRGSKSIAKAVKSSTAPELMYACSGNLAA
jgi:lysyl-tRNA synthetase class II